MSDFTTCVYNRDPSVFLVHFVTCFTLNSRTKETNQKLTPESQQSHLPHSVQTSQGILRKIHPITPQTPTFAILLPFPLYFMSAISFLGVCLWFQCSYFPYSFYLRLFFILFLSIIFCRYSFIHTVLKHVIFRDVWTFWSASLRLMFTHVRVLWLAYMILGEKIYILPEWLGVYIKNWEYCTYRATCYSGV